MSATPAPDHPPTGHPYVIGTAGHVDHGKSTLVRALTGIDPDRLAEERSREMTIDLGFAWLTLPDGREVSFIDVPGHERFVRNMLAGVGGVDVALLVIAADDGPMPQTREHLAILDLLGVAHGVVAITRVDLVDPEWRDLVVEEVRELIAPTSLGGSEIVPVSAVAGVGMDELVGALGRALDRAPARDSGGRPRLPIDRAFKVAGFGTVVTGTLLGGEIRTGDELALYPEGLPVRVRGIQAHQRQVDRVMAGSRVALNLSGVDQGDVHRGDVIAPVGALAPSLRLDARLSLLPDAPVALAQNDEVIVFLGTDEIPARVTLLDRDAIQAGENGWVQLRLSRPAVALRGDRFIVRRPTPAATIGGGVIVDAAPRRHRRFQPDVLAALEVLRQGTPEDLLLQALGDQPAELHATARAAAVEEPERVAAALVERGELVVLTAALDRRAVVCRTGALERLAARASEVLERWHASRPLEPGMRREDLRAALGIATGRVFDETVRELEARGVLRATGATVARPGFAISLTADQREAADAFLAAARATPYSPPAPADHAVGGEVITALQALGEVVQVSEQIAYPVEIYAEIRQRVLDKLERDTSITLAEYRDIFDTSRKYAQPTLEYLDETRVTRRKGDVRVRFRGPGAAG